MKKFNFFAGPAVLPHSVLEKASNAIKNFDNMGLSLIEISHRSKQFVQVMDDAIQLVKDIYQLPDNYEVMFLQGGASSQFYMVPFNLLPDNGTACYLDTGSWANKAIKEAAMFGNVEVVGSSKDSNYNYIPKDYTLPDNASYFHITTNNTIYGTEIHELPKTDIPIVADMSSDIFCKEMDLTGVQLIYAGAQKNLGPAGTTLVIVDKNALGKTGRQIPTMIDYNTHINKGSMFNTPPVFAVYVCYLTLKWIMEQGGLKAVEIVNRRKAGKLYDEIDRNPLFKGTVKVEDRSLMNATFVLHHNDNESAFMEMATAAGIMGIKGHRSVGGFRASIYNALEEEAVDVLVNVMQEFEKKFG